MEDKIQPAVLAALGCTPINYRNPRKLDEAATQITRFVLAAIDQDNPCAKFEKAETYVIESLALFAIDPPDTDSQHGFLDALMAVATEGLGIDINELPPRKPGRPKLRLVTTSEPQP
jgi:hypothetical protein